MCGSYNKAKFFHLVQRLHLIAIFIQERLESNIFDLNFETIEASLLTGLDIKVTEFIIESELEGYQANVNRKI